MHQEINKSRHQQGLCMRPIKSPMRTLYKHISLKLMIKFINNHTKIENAYEVRMKTFVFCCV